MSRLWSIVCNRSRSPLSIVAFVRSRGYIVRYLSLNDVKYSRTFLAYYLPRTLVSYIIHISSSYNSGLALYEIDDTVALLRNVLFRNHLDCLLCDYTSHEGSSVWNVGSRGTSSGLPLVGLNFRMSADLQLSDGVLESSFHRLQDRGAPQQRLHFCK